MTNQIGIVQLAADEWKAYRDLRLESLKESPQAFSGALEKEERLTEKEWREKLEKATSLKNRLLFAKLNGKAAGFLSAVIGDSPKLEHFVLIDTMYVSPEARNRGIAKQLVQALFEEIKIHPEIIKVQLAVTAGQKAAIGLYKKLGFKIVGELKRDLKVGEKYFDLYLMEKLLN